MISGNTLISEPRTQDLSLMARVQCLSLHVFAIITQKIITTIVNASGKYKNKTIFTKEIRDAFN